MSIFRQLTVLMLVAGFCARASAAPAPETVPLWPDGAPDARGDLPEDQPWLDVYLPEKEAANGAAMVVFPGGGYGNLALDHEGHQIARFLNEAGIAAFVLHYRLGSKGYHHPVQLTDALRSIRRVREGAARWQVDPDRVGVMGFSAGGHLASMTGVFFEPAAPDAADPVDRQSSRPDVLVLCYPVISLSTEHGHAGSRNNLLGEKLEPDSDRSREVSTELHVRPDSPPTFFFHTGEDTAVPPENSIFYYLALRKHGIPAEMHIYQKGPHGVGLMQGDPVLGTWGGHLISWLRTNRFLAAGERAAVQGTVTLNGVPVSWGSVTFHPENPHQAVTTGRIRNGKFQLPADQGPVVGPARLEFTVSIYEETRKPKDGPVRITSQKEGGEPYRVEVAEGMAPLEFSLSRP